MEMMNIQHPTDMECDDEMMECDDEMECDDDIRIFSS